MDEPPTSTRGRSNYHVARSGRGAGRKERIMMGIRAFAIGIAATLTLVGGPAVSSSQPRGDSVPVQLSSEGRFLGGGQTAMVRVRTVCGTKWSVIEAFVSIEQDGYLSQAGFFHPICDGV